jgi:hypothetical protein
VFGAAVEWRHAVLLGGRVGAAQLSLRLRQRLLVSRLVVGRQCRLSRAELSDGAVHLGQQDVELRAIGVRRRLAAGLVDKSPELVGVYAGLSLHVDIRQLPVHFRAESNELPDERLLDLTLVGCGRAAAPAPQPARRTSAAHTAQIRRMGPPSDLQPCTRQAHYSLQPVNYSR